MFILGGYYCMWLKKRQIQVLLKNFFDMEKRFQSARKYYLRVIHISLISISLPILVGYGLSLAVLCNNSKLTNSLFDKLLLGRNYTSYFPIKVLSLMFNSFVSLYLTQQMSLLSGMFYITLCIFLCRIIDECSHHLKLWISSTDVTKISTRVINEYSVIHDFANLLESTMSSEVLWICTANFTDLFAGISIALRFYSYGNPAYTYERLIYTIFNLMSFFIIIYFAAEVSRKDQILRKMVKEAAFVLSLSNESGDNGKLLYKLVKSKEDIVLSAWGVFSFTRSFLLASIAGLISFNLLLIQLDR
ncbi:uncharacterized protein TNIN_250691 [Trichonephila inaurata madagascariensis]|uniref:Uncharacterized protein n=1 Tax=Trichonephila inaurata madagascariensis TaxID=2747483 RepID=A0A8X6X2A2_9ARAC|nr:uncharacterized protein TNIN_322331 [Trichonephila inaurata madagascariensis]GFY44729.1 uncharacterized protein TNIN_250691 [Trichonephila inaurata madagascariensis]